VDIELAKKIARFGLCDACLGRQFINIEATDNKERGKKIREALNIEESQQCWLCDGLIDDIPLMAELAIDALKDYEFSTFLVGCKIDEEILLKEHRIATEASESIKREIDREIGKIIAREMNKLPDFKNPDIVVTIDTTCYDVEIDSKSIYIYGRYRKLVRNLPQTKWPCRHCNGLGCIYCNFTGKMYEESVEELIAFPALKASMASSESFHGAGREDIDVRMLGNGRPFVLELKQPKKRNIDLKKLEEEINKYAKGKVEVLGLKFSGREEVRKIKEAKHPKIYMVKIGYTKKEKIYEAVNALIGREISQATPTRVLHRRADIVRKRKILDIKIKEMKMNEATLIVKAESGTYIKELMTGDGGRTKPSLASLAGDEVKVLELDVIGIGDENEKVERI